MAAPHVQATSQALYRVFVQPLLSQPQSIRPALLLSRHAQPAVFPLQRTTSPHARSASSRPGLYQDENSSRPVVYRRPEIGNRRCDEEITAYRIQLVNNKTGLLDPIRYRTRDVLANLDRATHRLEEVQPAEDEYSDELPVCKIVNKQEAADLYRQREKTAKVRRRVTKLATSFKTLEINWAIDGHDLGHRLDKLVGFIREGRKVEVVLASKKKGRKATPAECEAVLQKFRDAVDGVPGARETAMEGKLGGFCTLSFKGPTQKGATTSDDGEDDNDEATPGNGQSEGEGGLGERQSGTA